MGSTNMFMDAVKELLGVEPHLALTYFMCVIIGVVLHWVNKINSERLNGSGSI